MSTRSGESPACEDPGRARRGGGAADVAEEVALVACARRELLLRVHRHRLRHADLEDCYSQAVLELIVKARRGAKFASAAHIANAIEQRFVSRVHDRRRALAGRSPMEAALEMALPLGGGLGEEAHPEDLRLELEQLVILRHELRRVAVLAAELTADQRLVLACQVGLQMECREFCRRFTWTGEKYRKVAQRARARLRELAARDERESHCNGTVERGARDSPVNDTPPLIGASQTGLRARSPDPGSASAVRVPSAGASDSVHPLRPRACQPGRTIDGVA